MDFTLIKQVHKFLIESTQGRQFLGEFEQYIEPNNFQQIR